MSKDHACQIRSGLTPLACICLSLENNFSFYTLSSLAMMIFRYVLLGEGYSYFKIMYPIVFFLPSFLSFFFLPLSISLMENVFVSRSFRSIEGRCSTVKCEGCIDLIANLGNYYCLPLVSPCTVLVPMCILHAAWCSLCATCRLKPPTHLMGLIPRCRGKTSQYSIPALGFF